jgi:glycosyltransferase involved in cell wall biosynthesis
MRGRLVSVLIPTFNRPHFLAEAVRSALAQTMRDVEVIVGDDGCEGGAVVAAIGDGRVRYQRNARRLGLSGNWEALIEASRGDFLLLLMDDDRLEPTFLARCLDEFNRDEDLGVVFTNHTFARQDGLAVRRCEVAPGRHDNFAEQFLKLRPVAVSAALWRSEVWPSVRPLPNTAAADMVLFGRIAELGCPFFYVDEPLMRYRVHDAMYSSTRAFRDEATRAWEQLSFSGARAQRERDRLLADSLLSLASAKIKEGDLASARGDVVRAGRLGPSSRLRSLGLRAAASHAVFARLALAFARLRMVFRPG